MSREKRAVSKEAALRRLVRKLIQEELKKQRHSANKCCDVSHMHEEEQPWAIFGEPTLDPALAAELHHESQMAAEWDDLPYYPEHNEIGSPPPVKPKRQRQTRRSLS